MMATRRPAPPPGGDVARSVGAQLEVARTTFHDTTAHAASIALDLRAESNFEAVRSQFDVLAAQVPHLRIEPT